MKEIKRPRVREMLFVDCAEIFRRAKSAAGMGRKRLNEKDFRIEYPQLYKFYPRQVDRDEIYLAYLQGFERGQQRRKG